MWKENHKNFFEKILGLNLRELERDYVKNG